MLGGGQMYPYPPPGTMAPPEHGVVEHPPAVNQNNWGGNDANTLLVVATLITTLAYQLGCNVPGGYWQDTKMSDDGKRVIHLAGDPVMRDLHRPRYRPQIKHFYIIPLPCWALVFNLVSEPPGRPIGLQVLGVHGGELDGVPGVDADDAEPAGAHAGGLAPGPLVLRRRLLQPRAHLHRLAVQHAPLHRHRRLGRHRRLPLAHDQRPTRAPGKDHPFLLLLLPPELIDPIKATSIAS